MNTIALYVSLAVGLLFLAALSSITIVHGAFTVTTVFVVASLLFAALSLQTGHWIRSSLVFVVILIDVLLLILLWL